MITQQQIEAVLNHPVYDREGAKIGDAKHVFVDDVTGTPDWVSVRTGMFGGHESFVPTMDARLIADHLEVPYSKSQVKDAPHADVASGGHLSAQEEQDLYQYYNLQWGTAGPAGEAEGTGRTGQQWTAATGGMAGTAGMGRDDAMTRSEEEMHVGVEWRETGRARLHKYVVVEDVEQTVPLRHEEVRVEREPITDANIGDATAGPDISEAEHTVTLHGERPVVETEVVPKERVRLGLEERSEQETVRGQVRKEEIEAELPDDRRGDRATGKEGKGL